ncbi:hypothetical protein BVY01_02095 [bacterium I07]|nr:hypothetical protein BVY01_02095 [bacterium I07]
MGHSKSRFWILHSVLFSAVILTAHSVQGQIPSQSVFDDDPGFIPGFSKAETQITLNAIINETNLQTGETERRETTTGLYWDDVTNNAASWVMSDFILTGKIISEGSNYSRLKETMTIMFSHDFKNIISFGYTLYLEDNIGGSGQWRPVHIESVAGRGIPFSYRKPDLSYYEYGVEGVESKLYITDISSQSNSWVENNGEIKLVKTRTTTDPSADENSEVYFKLYPDFLNEEVIIVSVKGDVWWRIRPGSWRTAKLGQTLPKEAEIATGKRTKGSEIILRYPDGTVTVVHAESQIWVSPGSFSPRTQIYLRVGGVAAQVKKSSVSRSMFKIRSPVAIMSVKGTSFYVKHDTLTNKTDVKVSSGQVTVSQGKEAAGMEKSISFSYGALNNKMSLADSVLLDPWQQVSVTDQGIGPTLAVVLNDVILNPESVTLLPFQVQQFKAKGIDTDGDPLPLEGNWQSTGGMITQNGYFFSNSDSGQYDVLFEEPISGLRTSSSVTIDDGLPNPFMPIYLISRNQVEPGELFWVDIHVGNSYTPALDLFGLSFQLEFTHTVHIDVVTPHAVNVLPGDLLGDDLVFFQTVDEASGKINVGLSRKAGQGGIEGHGSVLKVQFKAAAGTPPRTPVDFTLTDITANDENGNPIQFSSRSRSLTITDMVGTPEFDFEPGEYANPFQVTLSCNTESAVIYYTTDGSEPTQASTVYTDPVSISNTTTLRARAFKDGLASSFIASASYFISSTGVAVTSTPIPTEFKLDQNYPNPFNPATTIQYQLPEPGYLELNVYNIYGQKIRTLVNGEKSAGHYKVLWEGRNEVGQQVASGVYVYRIQAEDFVQSRKMLLMR